MSDQYYGEIRMFAGWGGTYAINGWAFCDGTLLQITDNTALYSLIGTTWGGDAVNTFKLPDMRGRTPIHYGKGQNLTQRYFGTSLGNDWVYLSPENLPSHNHPTQASSLDALEASPEGLIPGVVDGSKSFYDDPAGSVSTNAFSIHAVAEAGGGDSHENCMPSMPLSFLIALKGVYPDRP
jgi:microcystin-dependent protein